LHLHKEALEKIPLFQGASPTFLGVLVRHLKTTVCAPGETIMKCGDIGREMYFLQKGVCTMTDSSGEHIYSVLTSGTFFGEYALIFSQKRTATVRANTHCDLFMLEKSDFSEI